MNKSKIFLEGYSQNRDLSWLKFNLRVLEEAREKDVPILEKLKFLSIFCSNLDEFFMIRVGSIYQLSLMPIQKKDYRSGLSNKEQLNKIDNACLSIYPILNTTFKKIKNELKDINIHHLKYNQLSKKEKEYINTYYKQNISPIISPMIIDKLRPFPFIENKETVLISRMKKNKNEYVGILNIPKTLPPLLLLSNDKDIRFILMEDILMHYLENIFKSYKIINKIKLRIVRNSDISPNDEDYELSHDIRKAMKEMLKKRKRLSIMRVEMSQDIPLKFKLLLTKYLNCKDEYFFVNKTPFNYNYSSYLISKLEKNLVTNNTYPKFEPYNKYQSYKNNNIFDEIKDHDILLKFPYESMKPFLDLVKMASIDDKVESIFITIYRLSNRSKLVEYLCNASENGKDVTCLIELRARFDEENNINYSEILEEAGVRVIYGFEDYKVHSKLCLIQRNEDKINYYSVIGTGNFNESTVKQYTDLQLLTNDEKIGIDILNLFKNMLVGDINESYNDLIVSPHTLKDRIIELIKRETKKENNGFIFLKLNSLTDIDIMESLSNASNKGVNIILNIRGICCLIPNIKNKTENITLFNIVGRFLEHPRIYLFGKGKDEVIYISSADFMTRNTERRIEAGVIIKDENIKEEIREYIDILRSDNSKIRYLDNDRNYHKIEISDKVINSQEEFIKKYGGNNDD